MSVFKITNFGGQIPRVSPRALPAEVTPQPIAKLCRSDLCQAIAHNSQQSVKD